MCHRSPYCQRCPAARTCTAHSTSRTPEGTDLAESGRCTVSRTAPCSLPKQYIATTATSYFEDFNGRSLVRKNKIKSHTHTHTHKEWSLVLTKCSSRLSDIGLLSSKILWITKGEKKTLKKSEQEIYITENVMVPADE